MPLLTTIQQTNAAILAETRAMANHLASAAMHANAIVSHLLKLDNASLAQWLNERGEGLGELLTRHAETGDKINGAVALAANTLAESGIDASIHLVDTRPLSDKLTAQARVATLTEQGWLVENLPQPEPETENEQ